ncbi:MAG: cytochrome c biogenesis protein CcsA, partial [Planctomycetota bacterium]|nr:cytochrome c biogenesis protein CcsA [Planctomycetota bacterium]
ISPEWLARPEVNALLDEMSRDLIRTAKFVDAVRDATFVRQPGTLAGSLRVMPPPGEDRQQAWLPVDSLWQSARAPQDAAHAEMRRRVFVPDLDPKLQDSIADGWLGLAAAWQRQDAPVVNRALAGLADDLAKLNPRLYPAAEKLQLESWYVRYKAMVWIWMIYLLAVVPLLMSVIYHWLWARRVGLVFFLAAFGLHTTSIGIRWYLSGRIPNSNMFEAIIAASWFGAVAALIMEFLVRKSAMRNLFVLGSAVCAMVAMMCSHFMPVALTSDINHIMPVLNDVWLYIHTNVIIFSYCLIGMAATTALLYLGYRIFGGNNEYARSGGAGQLILAGAAAKPFVKAQSPGFGQVLDGATMVLMELSFVLLWTGLCMGAIWADHSWGRPWGWDPKEVFALNTFLVFLLLVHVRLKVRDKALWTAVLACVGCGVMLFNWIVVNFVITGLHSYA